MEKQIGDCCPNDALVTRVITSDLDARLNVDHIRSFPARGNNAVAYKALSRINGNSRSSRNKNVASFVDSGLEEKVSRGRQALRTIASTLIPGDIDPLRSPVRSAIYRTLTPGKPSGRGGSLPGQNRGYRCPEGYQYGGRFTDSRLSTCGAKLFDIPSALGLAIRALRALTRTNVSRTTGTPIVGLAGPGDIIASRKPQIPRVGMSNASSARSAVGKMVSEMGDYARRSNEKVRRMVRRDGFVLEPVVPNKVLRAIPDNRDMEGASFLMNTLSIKDIGGEELGLLSNTGVTSLVYVLPGGSTLTLEKARKLSIGERRKLGRVVNTSMEIDNRRDPAARLRNVASEIGPGIRYSESFKGIKNPNEQIGGTTRWAKQLLINRKLARAEEPQKSRETASFGQKGKLISSLDQAIEHLASGGSLGDIKPQILAELLTKQDLVRKQKLANNISIADISGKRLFLYESPKKYQHLAERFASDLQQHLGLESPDVFFVGKPGDKRKYLREDVETAIPGGKFDPNIKFVDLNPSDVATMMLVDFLTDQRERPMSSIYPIVTPDGPQAVLAENVTSGLVDLSKIEITKRMKMRIADFYSSGLVPAYSDYYQALKAEQRILFIKLISQLINKARSFNPKKFNASMDGYGLSEGEKIHINIITKLFSTRLEMLSNQKNVLREVIRSGAKK